MARGVWITDHAFYRGEVRGSLPLLLFNFPPYAESAQLEGCSRVAQAKRITRIGLTPLFPPPASLPTAQYQYAVRHNCDFQSDPHLVPFQLSGSFKYALAIYTRQHQRNMGGARAVGGTVQVSLKGEKHPFSIPFFHGGLYMFVMNIFGSQTL